MPEPKAQKDKSLRDGFGEALLGLGSSEKNIVVLTADLADSTRVKTFKDKFPERFFQLGVAEQNLIGVAAGLAITGKIPLCCSFATFLTGRAWEQIRVCVAADNLPLKLIGSHAGLSHPTDGFTAQATEDIAIMRCLPNMTVVYPADYLQMKQCLPAVVRIPGPVYLRMTRNPSPIFTKPNEDFKINQAQIIKPGRDITIVSAGPLLYEVIKAAENISYSCEIINLHTLKPIDKKTIVNSLKKTGCLLTVEDHQLKGGLGSAVFESVFTDYQFPMASIGLDDVFGQTAKSTNELFKKHHLDAESIKIAVNGLMKKKQ